MSEVVDSVLNQESGPKVRRQPRPFRHVLQHGGDCHRFIGVVEIPGVPRPGRGDDFDVVVTEGDPAVSPESPEVGSHFGDSGGTRGRKQVCVCGSKGFETGLGKVEGKRGWMIPSSAVVSLTGIRHGPKSPPPNW